MLGLRGCPCGGVLVGEEPDSDLRQGCQQLLTWAWGMEKEHSLDTALRHLALQGSRGMQGLSPVGRRPIGSCFSG